jgi:hypothetical protein
MAFPERALSEPRAIDSLLKEGWGWALNGGAAQHLVPPHPGPLARTYCGEPLKGGPEQLLALVLRAPECMRCSKKAGLA